MLVARPLQAFRVGHRQILTCDVASANPLDFRGKVFWFYRAGQKVGRIRVEGVSTASWTRPDTCDFTYSGDEIRPEQLADRPLICEGQAEDAIQDVAAS
jgi:hypothetical protein